MPYKSNAELPKGVKNLPEHAQTIFRKAFNAAYEEYGDERARKIAWGAVKNAGYKKGEGGNWTKTKDHDYQVVEQMVLDSSEMKRTKDGYLGAIPRVARTGIQVYRGFELGEDAMSTIRVYRPDTEVFDAASFATFAHRPVTIEHPPELVTADNWKKLAVGQSGDEVVRDGQYVRVPILLMDGDAIKEVEGGRRELSAGYTMELDWTPGETPTGDTYDAVQKSIRVNHIAVTKRARGGDQLRIGDAYLDEWIADVEGDNDMPSNTTTILVGDKRVTVDEESAPIILRALKDATDANGSLDERIKALESELEKLRSQKKSSDDAATAKDAEIERQKVVVTAKDSEIANLKQQLVDNALSPEKLDQIVKDRAEIIQKAKSMLGDKLVVDGKTNSEIMRQVVDARVGAAARDYKDDAVRIAFDTLTVTAPVSDALADALSRRRASPSFGQDAREEAHDKRCDYLESAWKTPIGGTATRQ